jgi:hypothetical protein
MRPLNLVLEFGVCDRPALHNVTGETKFFAFFFVPELRSLRSLHLI